MVSNWHMGLVDLHIVYITRINSVLHLRKLFLLCHCCLASGTLPHGPLTHPTHCLVSYHYYCTKCTLSDVISCIAFYALCPRHYNLCIVFHSVQLCNSTDRQTDLVTCRAAITAFENKTILTQLVPCFGCNYFLEIQPLLSLAAIV